MIVFSFLFSFLPQTGVGLRPAGLCLWTVPPGGVHVDLHVSDCAGGSLLSVPPVDTEPVWVLPQVVQFPVWFSVPALPGSGPWFSSHICGGDQQYAACVLLHHHSRTGRMACTALSQYFNLLFREHYLFTENLTLNLNMILKSLLLLFLSSV